MIINNQYIDSNAIVSIRYNRDFNQLQIDAGNFEYFFNISTNLDFQTLYAYLLSLKNFENVDIADIEFRVAEFEKNFLNPKENEKSK